MVDVDLSNNLLVAWEEVAALVHALPNLRALTLSHNALQPFPRSPPSLASAFSSLRALVLNAVPCAWSAAYHLASTGSLPLLAELHLAHNALSTLHPTVAAEEAKAVEPVASDVALELARCFPALTALDLSHNRFGDWEVICALRCLPRLHHLILNHNQLTAVTYPALPASSSAPQSTPPVPFACLSTLSLSDNRLQSFASFSALAAFPSLTSLAVQRNPRLDELASTPALLRLHCISRVPRLLLLNGSTIQRRERSDADKFYMAYAEEQWRGREGEDVGKKVGDMFERYEELRRKRGMGAEEAQGGGGQGVKGEGKEDPGAGTLARNTAEVQLRLYDEKGEVQASGTKRLLLTTKVSALRALLDRHFKLSVADRGRYVMEGKEEESSSWEAMDDGMKLLSYFGLKEGSVVALRAKT